MNKWKMVKLNDAFELQMGKTPSRNEPSYWTNGLFPWVSIADLSSNGKYIGRTKEKLNKKAVVESGIKSVPAGTVIMSFKLSIGKTAITECDLYTNEAIMAFHDKGKYNIDSNYIYHLFSSMDWGKGSNKAVMGITLNKASLSDIFIPLPPLEEQKKIAATLDTVSDLIRLRKRQIEELDLLVKARFVEMFIRYFDSDYERPLNMICTFIDYRGRTPEKSDKGIPLITAKNVKDNAFSIEPQEFIPEENYKKVMTRGVPKVNDVLFTTEAPLGNVCRIPNIYDKFCVGQRIISMQPNPDMLTSEYLEYALLSEKFQLKVWEKSSGSTVVGIRSKLLEWLTLPVPSIGEQENFTSFVSDIDKTKSSIRECLEKFDLFKKVLLQQYFGGIV